MAGGTWTTLGDKRRPGAYLNFIGTATPTMTVGSRGIGTLAIPLSWGSQEELIEVYSSELANGNSLKKVGFTAFDAESKVLGLMLSNCYKALVYRLDSGGEKAAGYDEKLFVTAKYTGTLGNTITVQVTEIDGLYRVITYVGGTSRDVQTVSEIEELENNDFVVFEGSGSLVINAGITLTGGTNGTINTATAYPAYLALAEMARWQTMALTQDNDMYAAQFAKFADRMRNYEGRYVQVVVSNYNADLISAINSDCGAIVDGVTVTAEEATAWVAGITAGAAITQSNVGRVFPGATRILHERSNTEIIEALEKGMFILSTNQNGDIIVEDDINSLTTLTLKLTEDYKLNQIIRVLDEVGTSVSSIWETSFKGLVQNNENGRNIFKATLLTYFEELQRLGAIENFAGADDIEVDAVEGKKDSVALTVYRLDPVVAMSKLYGLIFTA